MSARIVGDDRGVSTTLSYVLTLTITTLLLTGLVIATGTYVEDRRQEVVDSQMEVVGQQVAATIESADYLASTRGDVSGSTTVRIVRDLPDQVARAGYVIEVNPDGNQNIVVRSEEGALDVEVTVSVVIESGRTLESTSIQGGSIVVEYDESSNALEVESNE